MKNLIEFGIDKNNQIYIFQVRPIIIKNKFLEDNVRYLSSSIEEAKINLRYCKTILKTY